MKRAAVQRHLGKYWEGMCGWKDGTFGHCGNAGDDSDRTRCRLARRRRRCRRWKTSETVWTHCHAEFFVININITRGK